MPEVPPEVVGEILRSAVTLPAAFDLEGLRIEHEDPAGTVAFGIAKRVHVDPVGPAMGRVRTAVAGLSDHLVGLDHLCETGVARIGLGVEDVDSRRPQARHDEVAPLHMRVRGGGTQARAARIPPEVVELVAGARHVDARDLRAVTRRCGIDVEDGQRVAAGRIGVEQGDIRDRFHGRAHGHRRRRIEGLVGKQFGHV